MDSVKINLSRLFFKRNNVLKQLIIKIIRYMKTVYLYVRVSTEEH